MRNENGCIRVFANRDQIERSKKKVFEVNPSVSKLSIALGLAGNEVRLNILFLLYEESELCVCDLSDILEMKAPAISQHLKKMKAGKLVDFRKEGQTTYYFLNEDYHALFEPFFEMIANYEVLRKVS